MPLADLINIPTTPEEWKFWSFAHMDQHNKIINAVFQQNSNNLLPPYILDPMPDLRNDQIKTWLELNQSAHDGFNAAINASGNDLSTVDWSKSDQVSSWVRLHFNEHYQAQLTLGFPD